MYDKSRRAVSICTKEFKQCKPLSGNENLRPQFKISLVLTGWPLFWKTWKSQGIEKWSGKIGSQGKSGKMNYYIYSVATIITLWISYSFLYKPILSHWSILDNVVVIDISV